MSASPERGLVVGSRYRLESVLGEGGMAVVWTAVHTETDRKVALKLVRADYVRNETIREMFVREARVAARIGKNDHIVDVLDAGVDASLQVPFIAMELLEGRGLDAHIRKDGPIPPTLVADLLEQLSDGLEQAHAAGVFHRDLKPQNLFLTRDRKGKPLLKVLDFGIAKLSESTQASATNVGTPAYSAPEQLGESWRSIARGRGKIIAPQVSAATDVWAVGLIAYEMLTGAAPGTFWGAQTLAELPVKIVLEPLPSAAVRADPALLPPTFDAWLARCLDVEADKRFPSVREAVEKLLPALRGLTRASVAPAAAPQRRPPPAPAAAPQGPPPGTSPPGKPPAHVPRYAHWGAPAPGGFVDARMNAWVAHRRAELRAPGDTRSLQVWPVIYLPRVEAVVRDARVQLSGAVATFAEVVASDPLRKAIGEDRMLVALIQAPRLACRAAARSKRSSGGLVDGMSRGLKALDALMGAPPLGILRDPQFEAYFEVWATSPHEAQVAFPVSLRQVLVSGGFHGIIERFPGAIVLTHFDAARFDPADLDRVLELSVRLLAAIP